MGLDPSILKTLPIWFVAFLFSSTFHEAAHAFVGMKLGDPTAEDQVTLDPTPHVRREPFGMILMPLVSFFFYGGQWMLGWASAPYDPRWASRYPKRSALVAAAGPLANLLLCGLAMLGMRIGLAKGFFLPPTTSFGLDSLVVGAAGRATAMSTFLSVLFSMNLLLGTFNLMPFPPLDGHAIVPLALSDRLAHRWSALFDGPGRMLGLFVAMLIHQQIFSAIFFAVVAHVYG